MTTTTVSSPARGGGARRASTGSVMATPSQHLDFRGVSQDVDDDDESDDARVRRRPPRVSFSSVVEEEPVRPRRERAWSDDDAYSTAGSQARGQLSPGGTPSRRRKVVYWTKREEQFIIQGVKNYGLGHWRKILEDGKGVFHHQRTNVDIKDKWKNLLRKVALTPEEEEIVDTRIWRETVAARMIERMLPSLRQRAAEASGAADAGDSLDGSGNGGNAREDTPPRTKRRRLSQGSTDAIQFFVGTDASAPHLRAVTVTPRECPTIAALKRVLARQLLEDLPLSNNLLLVSIHTRRLLGDLESVEDCAERDGRELYLLYDP